MCLRPAFDFPRLHAGRDACLSRGLLFATAPPAAVFEMHANVAQAEAKAHKVGQKATERALAAQAKAEQAKIQQRRMRAQK